MDKHLLFTACSNSALLALFFVGFAVDNFSKKKYIWGAIGIVVTLCTLQDAYTFYTAM